MHNFEKQNLQTLNSQYLTKIQKSKIKIYKKAIMSIMLNFQLFHKSLKT